MIIFIAQFYMERSSCLEQVILKFFDVRLCIPEISGLDVTHQADISSALMIEFFTPPLLFLFPLRDIPNLHCFLRRFHSFLVLHYSILYLSSDDRS